jgi:hypothetical protein
MSQTKRMIHSVGGSWILRKTPLSSETVWQVRAAWKGRGVRAKRVREMQHGWRMILTDVRQGCGVGVQKMYTRAIGGCNVKASEQRGGWVMVLAKDR